MSGDFFTFYKTQYFGDKASEMMSRGYASHRKGHMFNEADDGLYRK